jgi:hypothetical protein
MGAMAKIAICLLTYSRTEYAIETLRSTLDLLDNDGDKVHVHIADDGSEPEHRAALYTLASEHPDVFCVTWTNAKRGGYGKNFNLATQITHNVADYVLVIEDDWCCPSILDVPKLIRALDAPIGIECIRLGYMSFTQALRGRVMSAPPHWEKYLLLDPESEEPHVFAGHPRFESVAYQKRVGPCPEGLLPGQTEFAVAHMPEARRGVAWPMWVDPSVGMFQHIGTLRSY